MDAVASYRQRSHKLGKTVSGSRYRLEGVVDVSGNVKQLQRDEIAGGVMRTITLVVAITLFSVGALAQGHGTAPFFFRAGPQL